MSNRRKVKAIAVIADELVLSGIQVDNPKNRAYAQRMGVAEIPWPLPYANSVIMQCDDCEGDMWVGPLIRQHREKMEAAKMPVRHLCLLCAALEGRRGDTTMFKLSNKKAGE